MQDAEDVLQETPLAASRGLARFEERTSVRGWLYRIATNRCLNVLRDSRRKPQQALMAEPPAPTRLAEPVWLDPYPDALLEGIPDHAPGPEARYETRESVELAFIAGLAHLPPRQRVVLVLRDVLGFRAAEAADADRHERLSRLGLPRRLDAADTKEPRQGPGTPGETGSGAE